MTRSHSALAQTSLLLLRFTCILTQIGCAYHNTDMFICICSQLNLNLSCQSNTLFDDGSGENCMLGIFMLPFVFVCLCSIIMSASAVHSVEITVIIGTHIIIKMSIVFFHRICVQFETRRLGKRPITM